jgi:hypothetical protein
VDFRPRSRDRRAASSADTLRPLNGALTPPWAFAGPLPFHFGRVRLVDFVSRDALPDVSPPEMAPR